MDADALMARLDAFMKTGEEEEVPEGGHLPPDELQDRLDQLRNPGKKERDLEHYIEKQREYIERYGDEYDFGQKYAPGMPLKREELPLDTGLYNEGAGKTQRKVKKKQSKKQSKKKKKIPK